jgi:hypothetical protein
MGGVKAKEWDLITRTIPEKIFIFYRMYAICRIDRMSIASRFMQTIIVIDLIDPAGRLGVLIRSSATSCAP